MDGRIDGGPAFPRSGYKFTSDDIDVPEEGMSLLDHFAGLAMQADLSQRHHGYSYGSPEVAARAYAVGQAMLAERQRLIAVEVAKRNAKAIGKMVTYVVLNTHGGGGEQSEIDAASPHEAVDEWLLENGWPDAVPTVEMVGAEGHETHFKAGSAAGWVELSVWEKLPA